MRAELVLFNLEVTLSFDKHGAYAGNNFSHKIYDLQMYYILAQFLFLHRTVQEKLLVDFKEDC